MYRISIDRSLCNGYGVCESTRPRRLRARRRRARRPPHRRERRRRRPRSLRLLSDGRDLHRQGRGGVTWRLLIVLVVAAPSPRPSSPTSSCSAARPRATTPWAASARARTFRPLRTGPSVPGRGVRTTRMPTTKGREPHAAALPDRAPPRSSGVGQARWHARARRPRAPPAPARRAPGPASRRSRRRRFPPPARELRGGCDLRGAVRAAVHRLGGGEPGERDPDAAHARNVGVRLHCIEEAAARERSVPAREIRPRHLGEGPAPPRPGHRSPRTRRVTVRRGRAPPPRSPRCAVREASPPRDMPAPSRSPVRSWISSASMNSARAVSPSPPSVWSIPWKMSPTPCDQLKPSSRLRSIPSAVQLSAVPRSTPSRPRLPRPTAAMHSSRPASASSATRYTSSHASVRALDLADHPGAECDVDERGRAAGTRCPAPGPRRGTPRTYSRALTFLPRMCQYIQRSPASRSPGFARLRVAAPAPRRGACRVRPGDCASSAIPRSTDATCVVPSIPSLISRATSA